MAYRKPLKNSLIGFETEMFTIGRNGALVNAADILLKKAKQDKNLTLKKEIARSMIEIASYPNATVPETMLHLLEETEYLISIAEKENVLLCPLASYPGRYNPSMRDDKKYMIKSSIFGKERHKIEGRLTGFHCHYTLPRGIFDSQIHMLKMLTRSKIKDSVVNSYNMLIAADPALTCFMQSSPFYQGEYIGKDSRVIMYRGGKPLNNMKGLYANFQQFGGLPYYKLTAFDLIDLIKTRYEKWVSHIKSLGLNIKVLSLYGSILYTTWGPVRISPHGTIEQRGMDMNHPPHIMAAGVVIRHVLKRLQEEYYTVVPSEIGIKEPFKVEGDTIYIPPFPYVKNELQRLSAYRGLESDIVYNYCKRFLKFAMSTMPKDKHRLVEPFLHILNKRKTVSDEILDYVKKKGWKKGNKLGNSLAKYIALHHSERLLEEIKRTKRMLS